MDLRTTVTRAATGVGALALVLGAAACTGGDDEQPTAAPTPTATTSEAAPQPSDGGGDVTDEDLTAAADRFIEFLQAMDDGDWDAACTHVLDPETGTAPEGERLQLCAERGEAVMGEYGDVLQPGTFDDVDSSMVIAQETGDDTLALSVAGEPMDIPMVRGDDGQWYLSIPF